MESVSQSQVQDSQQGCASCVSVCQGHGLPDLPSVWNNSLAHVDAHLNLRVGEQSCRCEQLVGCKTMRFSECGSIQGGAGKRGKRVLVAGGASEKVWPYLHLAKEAEISPRTTQMLSADIGWELES